MSSAYIEIVVSGACRSCEVTDGELVELGVRALELGVGVLELGAAALQRVGHRVEAAGEVAELVVAAGRDPRRQLAGGEAPRRRGDRDDGRTTARRR